MTQDLVPHEEERLLLLLSGGHELPQARFVHLAEQLFETDHWRLRESEGISEGTLGFLERKNQIWVAPSRSSLAVGSQIASDPVESFRVLAFNEKEPFQDLSGASSKKKKKRKDGGAEEETPESGTGQGGGGGLFPF